MEKILLFYPSFEGGDAEKPLYTDIPLSVVALAGELNGVFDVEIIDERIQPLSGKLEKRLYNVLAVGISATTSRQIINGLRFAQKVRSFNKRITIIWGGWHPSLMPDETIRHELVDVIIRGQGERILPRLLLCLRNKGDLSKVPNIIYKTENAGIQKTFVCEFPDLQMPNSMKKGYQYIRLENYLHSGWGNKRILGYESSRGCPFQCKFCSIGSLFRRSWYGIPAKNIFQDICYLKENYGIDGIHFFDNNFFVDKRRVFEWSDYMRAEHLNVRWDGTGVVRQFLSFTDKEIERLKESGFYRIIAGIESGDEDVLKKIGKQHKNQEVLKLVEKCKEWDILPSLSFMVGFPWNPEKDFNNTIHLIEQIKEVYHKTEILLFIFSPYLGTPIYDTAKDYHMTFPKDLEGWAGFTYDKPNTPWLTEHIIKKMSRYLSFFGTKEMGEGEKVFWEGFDGR